MPYPLVDLDDQVEEKARRDEQKAKKIAAKPDDVMVSVPKDTIVSRR